MKASYEKVKKDLSYGIKDSTPCSSSMSQHRILSKKKLNKSVANEKEYNRYNEQDAEYELKNKLDFVKISINMLRQKYKNAVPRQKLLRHEESPEEFNKKCAQAEKFIEMIKIDKQIFEDEKINRNRLFADKKRRQQEEREAELQHKKEMEKEKRVKELLEDYKRLRKEREQQQIKWAQAQKKLPPKESTYLYRRYEDKYQKEIQLPMIEKYNEDLLKRKKMIKSVTSNELEEHKRTHDQRIIVRAEEKRKELMGRQEIDKTFIEQQKRFQSKISKDTKNRDEELKKMSKLKQLEKKAMRQKMLNYSDVIKDVCKINRSSKKIREIAESIKKLKHPVRESRDVRKEYSLAHLNMPTRHKTPMTHSTSVNEDCKYIKKINYLPELKKQRLKYYNEISNGKYNWKENAIDLNGSSEADYNNFFSKVNIMEKNVKIQEHLIENTRGHKQCADKEILASDMLMNIVKAKLAMFDKLQ